MAAITHEESAAVFYWKGKSLEEYSEGISNSLTWPGDDGKGHILDLIVDYGGDMTLLIHEGKNAEDVSLKDCTVPDHKSMDNAEFKIFQTITKLQLDGIETDKWKHSNMCIIVSEETAVVVNRMYNMEKKGTENQN